MNVFLAPMTGVSDMAFRRLVKRMGAGLVVSEMIASQAMIRQTRQSMRMVQAHGEEPMVVQLAGCEPEVMAEAARLNEDLGAKIIDINMGCPVKKVVNGHAGSALMRDEDLATRIIEATVKAVKIPVTLKMRTGWDDKSRNAPKLAKIAEDLGIQMITVHGRTRCQLYNGRSDWQFIRQVKDAVKIPVIGNGDVVKVEDAKNLLDLSGADGVMIGRGSYGRPWFINQAYQYIATGSYPNDPTLVEQLAIVLEHFEAILDLYGIEGGVKIARKHLGWYSKGLKNSAEFRVIVNQNECPIKMRGIVTNFYEQQPEFA
jgi:tRNA-dihydrouridine synthase B